jgi:hypothetical protein
MNCFVHDRVAAVGICAGCQKAVCHQCVARDAPRLVCQTCSRQQTILGFEYRSPIVIGGWPLIHICAGVDPQTMRPRVAKGVIAIGNIAVGGVAIAGLACGVITLGGLSVGLGFALGGVALGLGLSAGGLAVGSIAVGGAALGFMHAVGGVAFGPSIVDGRHCDARTLELVRAWLRTDWLPPNCR